MVFLITIFTFLSGANEIDKMIDGEAYRCEKLQRSVTMDDCVTQAFNGGFSQAQAIQLCQGQNSVAPIDCAVRAYNNGVVDVSGAIELCWNARDMGPADCAIDAKDEPFSSVELCKNGGSLERSGCAKEVRQELYLQGIYFLDEAIMLCKVNNAAIVIRTLRSFERALENRVGKVE